MRSLVTNRMKQLCRGLALLALVQPALSLGCPCMCDSHREGIPASDGTASSHCHQDGAACCHHDHIDGDLDADCGSSDALSLLALVEFHPCQCPSDCDCQLQHSSAKTAAIRPTTSDSAWRPLKLFADCPYFTLAPRPLGLPGNSRQLEGKRPVSAQSACAELCRFLS